MIYKYSDAEVILKQKEAVGKSIGKANNCEFVELTIQPSNVIESHSLDIPVTFFVVKGKGQIKIDGEIFPAEQGDLVVIKPKSLREWKNTGDTELCLLAVKHL